jgi:hypothetical protein
MSGGLRVEVAVEQILPRGCGLFGLQGRRIELLGGLVGAEQPAAAASVALHIRRRRTGVGNGVANRSANSSTASTSDVLDLLDERVDIAPSPQPKRWKCPWLGPGRGTTAFLVVERAQPLQQSAPARRNCVVADHVLDRDAFAMAAISRSGSATIGLV